MKAAPRPWLLIGWTCLGVLLAAADLTALSTLIPQITVDLEVPLPGGLTDVAWVVSAYLISTIVALPLSGRLADQYNRRIVLIGCLLIFIIGSVASAAAPSVWFLVAARAVQGVGAGAMVPVSMALATDLLPRARWALAFGLISAVDTIGWAIGPLYGALFVRQLGWRYLFWVNVPLAILIILGAGFALRDVPLANTRRRIDWWGALLLTGGLTALNLGLSRLGGGAAGGISFTVQASGVPWRAAVPWLVTGIALLALFVRVQMSTTMPLLQLRWLLQPRVAAAAVLCVVFGGLLITPTINVPLFFNAISGEGSNPDEAIRSAATLSGLVLLALTGVMALGAPLGGSLAERWSVRVVVGLGALLIGVGFWLMGGWQASTPVTIIMAQLALVGLGLGLLLAPPATVIVAMAPASERGVASSLVLLLRLSGMSVGLSALTAWSLQRFDSLSRAVSLPALTGQVVAEITVDVLTTTFSAAVALALCALLLALLHPRRLPSSDDEGSSLFPSID